MNAIILAAGQGTRLKPLTNDKPKCLVPLFGKSILEWQLDLFNSFKIKNISVVKGYLQEKITFENIHYFENSNYDKTNMVETLFCARDQLFDDVIVSYGDIIFERNVLQKLLDSKDDISLIIDKNWEKYWKIRFDNPLDDAETLTIDSNGYILDIGQKTSNIEMIQGQYIGLMRFQNDGVKFLRDFYDNAKKIATVNNNPLNPDIPFEKSYMTDLLWTMVDSGFKIKSIPITGGWLELDSYDDFIKYENMVEEKTLSQFFNVEN